MNLNLEVDFYQLEDQIIIIYDDVSLDVGNIRVRRKGSAGGHNGIKSIISCLGSENFPRVKIGVGKKPTADYDMVKWVLGEIPKEKNEEYRKAIENSVSAAEEIIENGVDSAMNKYSH